MIRELSARDRDPAIALLTEAAAANLYLLGNIDALGFGSDICQFWGDFDADNRLCAVLNRYISGWSLYGRAAADWSGLGTIIDRHPVPATRLQDNPGGIESLLPYISRYRATGLKVEELMVLERETFRPVSPPGDIAIRRATIRDLTPLIELYANAGHMQRSALGVERPLRDTRVWIAQQGERIQSVALTNAETQALAMIGGVFTIPTQRGRGLSQAVCSALCTDLLAERKQPVLYWETAAAGAVYRKLGFLPIGLWRSVWLGPIDEA